SIKRENSKMPTLMPSMWVGLTAVVVTAILLATDWHVWGSRYQISQECGTEVAQPPLAKRKNAVRVARASGGRELVAILAPREGNAGLSFHQVEGGSMDHWA